LRFRASLETGARPDRRAGGHGKDRLSEQRRESADRRDSRSTGLRRQSPLFSLPCSQTSV
jgi:hypothetical protein